MAARSCRLSFARPGIARVDTDEVRLSSGQSTIANPVCYGVAPPRSKGYVTSGRLPRSSASNFASDTRSSWFNPNRLVGIEITKRCNARLLHQRRSIISGSTKLDNGLPRRTKSTHRVRSALQNPQSLTFHCRYLFACCQLVNDGVVLRIE